MTHKKLPWFKQYPANFIEGVAGMTGEQIGVYSVLYNLMYARGRKLETRSRRDDMAGLARVCGVSTRQFGIVLQDLIGRGKITMDSEGRLSNPKFERMTQKDDIGTDSVPEEAAPVQLSGIYLDFSSGKNAPNDDISTGIMQATLNENKGLTSKNPVPVRARARHRVQKTEEDSILGGGSAAPPAGTAEHMDPAGFEEWKTACARTIPKGWSPPAALKRWLQIPHVPTAHMIEAWHAYIQHNREQGKGHKFKPKTRHPESWLKDRVYLSFLETVEQRLETDRNAAAARSARDTARQHTVDQWTPERVGAIAAIIGMAKFDAFVGTTLTIDQAGTTIDFHKNDHARSMAEQMHHHTAAQVFPQPVNFTSDRKRTSDAAFAAKRAQKP